MKLPKFRLVDDWRDAYKWWVMHVNGIGFVLSVIKAGIVAASAVTGWIGVLPKLLSWSLVAALFIIGMVVRILKQPGDP